MNKTQLYIWKKGEDRTNAKMLDVFENELYINYVKYDFDNIGSRYSDYTQTIKLPLSDNNKIALGNIQHTQIAKREINYTCDLYVDYVPLITNGVFTIISYDIPSKTITSQITGAGGNLIANLNKGKKLNDLDYPDVDSEDSTKYIGDTLLINGRDSISKNNPNTSTMFFAVMDCFNFEPSSTDNQLNNYSYYKASNTLTLNNQMPMVRAKRVLEKIVKEQGYELDTTELSEHKTYVSDNEYFKSYDNLAFPLTTKYNKKLNNFIINNYYGTNKYYLQYIQDPRTIVYKNGETPPVDAAQQIFYDTTYIYSTDTNNKYLQVYTSTKNDYQFDIDWCVSNDLPDLDSLGWTKPWYNQPLAWAESPTINVGLRILLDGVEQYIDRHTLVNYIKGHHDDKYEIGKDYRDKDNNVTKFKTSFNSLSCEANQTIRIEIFYEIIYKQWYNTSGFNNYYDVILVASDDTLNDANYGSNNTIIAYITDEGKRKDGMASSYFPNPFKYPIRGSILKSNLNINGKNTLIVPVNGLIQLKGNLPDITQIDYLKAILNLYNAYLVIDEMNKKATIKQLQNDLSNTDNILDLSSSYNNKTGIIKYSFDDLTKHNYIKCNGNADITKDEDFYTVVNYDIAKHLIERGIEIMVEDWNGVNTGFTSIKDIDTLYDIAGSKKFTTELDKDNTTKYSLLVKSSDIATDGVEWVDKFDFTADKALGDDEKDLISLPFVSYLAKSFAKYSDSDDFKDSDDSNDFNYNYMSLPIVDNNGTWVEAPFCLCECPVTLYRDRSVLQPITTSSIDVKVLNYVDEKISTQTNLPVATNLVKYKSNNYDCSLSNIIKSNYNNLQTNYNSPIIIENAEFKIKVNEVTNLINHLIYVEALGGVYLVTKVANYQPGKICKLNLLKLKEL